MDRKLFNIKKEIDSLINKGIDEEVAISNISQQENINPHYLKKLFNNKELNNDDNSVDVGSYILLNNDDKIYEIVKINNGKSVVIKDINSDVYKTVSNSDISPFVMENKMGKKLNETKYNLTINDLETTDAGSISELLSMSNKIDYDSNNNQITSMANLSNDTSDTNYTDYVDSNDANVVDTSNDFEYMPNVNDSYDENYTDNNEIVEGQVKEDVLLDPRTKDDTYNKNMKDDKMDDEESEDDELNEANTSVGNIEVQDDLLDNEYQKRYIDGVETHTTTELLNSIKDINPNIGIEDYYYDNNTVYMIIPIRFSNEITQRIVDRLKEKYGNDIIIKFARSEYAPEQKKIYVGFKDFWDSYPEDLDEQINNVLRNSGVKLNEVSEEEANKGKKDLPQMIGKNTFFGNKKQNGNNPGENQRPKYMCIKNKNVMGKEGNEGFKEPLTVGKVCCNESKIKNICETARNMYSKKDKSEWLSLDRRYIEKLMLEGIGYKNSSRLLQKIKKNI